MFDRIYREFTGKNITFAGIVYDSRKQVLERSFSSDLNALTHRLRDIAAGTRSGRDFTFSQLHRAIEENYRRFSSLSDLRKRNFHGNFRDGS